MSRIDDYEQRRGPVRRGRFKASRRPKPKPAPQQHQLSMKLFGGTTAKDKGVPFDDPIPF